MMKRLIPIIIAIIIAFITQTVQAQQFTYELANSADQAVEFTLSRSDISVQGHGENRVVIENKEYEAPPERAKGLKPLYGGGADNTGIGLSIEEQGGVLKIVQATSNSGHFVVKIPRNVRLMIEEANWGGGDIQISNHSGEIEIKSKNGDMDLQNITGPVIANSTSGDLNIVFDEISSANPTFVSLVSGYVDVTLPADSQLDFSLSSITGEIYSGLDIQMKGSENKMQRLGGGRSVEGTLNGGGTDMSLKTISGDIYLRKK